MGKGDSEFSVWRKSRAQWVEYIMMEVQGNSEGRLQNGKLQLNLVLKDNLCGPHYVKKN